MARITTRDCERVVSNRYELVLHADELARELLDPSLLAREPPRMREAKSVVALRRVAERATDPEILRINVWRRSRDVSLLGECNDNRSPVQPASAEAQAA
jgi:DNA-directed RNA polymerase subunit K/omega